LDEYSPISDTPLPSTLFTSLVREQGGTEEVQEWADETVGDTHLGKWKTRLGPSDRKEKRSKSLIKSKRKKTLMITQPTLVLVMMAAMVMLDYMAREGVVQEGVVQKGVVQDIGVPLEEVGSPIPHKIHTMVHLIHSRRQ
jgi:hypothetical protein